MNRNHVLLTELGVSSPELDALVEIACAHGAAGAKLTGGGGGGAMIALCPGGAADVVMAMRQQGFASQVVVIS